MKIIYNLGANRGLDIPYYLLKSDRVVAVEANPTLCQDMQKTYADQIASGKLHVIQCAVTPDPDVTSVSFAVHRSNDLLSSLSPGIAAEGEYERVTVPARTLRSLVDEFGSPWFIKIDLEGLDSEILDYLIAEDLLPDYLSVEAHSLRLLVQLTEVAGYQAFKSVDSSRVAKDFASLRIGTSVGTERYRFPDHSAGPFGEDIPGPWFDTPSFTKVVAMTKVGWRDIHAARAPEGPTVHDLGLAGITRLLCANVFRRYFPRLR